MNHFVYFDPVFAYLVLAIKKSLKIPKRSIYNICIGVVYLIISIGTYIIS